MKRRAIKIMFLSMLIVVMIFSSNQYAAEKRTLGDINKDDVVDARDQLLIMRHIMASTRKTHPEWILSGDRYKLADLTQNGRVDNSDMLKILRYIAATRNSSTIGKKHRDWLILGDIDLEPDIEVSSIKLNKTNVELDMSGTKTATLIATIEPNNATNKIITYNSSNTEVAIVDENGIVTAKANGTATITAKTANGKEAICTVKVTTSVTSIALNKTSVNLDMSGTKTVQLTATVKPDTATNKIITWSSGNTNIATVDSKGKVTAKANGTAQIIAKTSNGKTCKTTIKVITNPTKIKLNTTSSEIYPNANIKDVKLKITLEPSTVTEKKITWRTSNTKIATVDKNGKVVGKSNGTVNIKATSQNGKVTAICKVKVDTKVLGYTGSKADKLGYIQQSNKGYPIKGGASTHYMWCDNVSLVHSVILLTGNYNITPNSVYKEALKKWRIFKFEYTVEWYISRLL